MKKIYLNSFSKLLLTGLLGASLLNGCKKDSRPTVDVDTKAAQDNSKGQYVFNNVNHIVDDAARSQGGVNKMDGTPCMTVQSDSSLNNPSTNYFPRTLTCTFIDSCKAPNGDVRKGKMIIVFTRRLSDSAAVITTTFNNFYLNGYKVEGTLTEKNNGRDPVSRLSSFSFNLPDGKITSSSGDVMTLSLTQTKQLLNGKGTPTVMGDAYQLTGSSSGMSAGASFTATITKPLMFDASVCQFLTSGVLEVRPAGKDLRTVDFGNGACTGTANVTIAGTSFTINQSGK